MMYPYFLCPSAGLFSPNYSSCSVSSILCSNLCRSFTVLLYFRAGVTRATIVVYSIPGTWYSTCQLDYFLNDGAHSPNIVGRFVLFCGINVLYTQAVGFSIGWHVQFAEKQFQVEYGAPRMGSSREKMVHLYRSSMGRLSNNGSSPPPFLPTVQTPHHIYGSPITARVTGTTPRFAHGTRLSASRSRSVLFTAVNMSTLRMYRLIKQGFLAHKPGHVEGKIGFGRDIEM